MKLLRFFQDRVSQDKLYFNFKTVILPDSTGWSSDSFDEAVSVTGSVHDFSH